jgi:hypothetical protein
MRTAAILILLPAIFICSLCVTTAICIADERPVCFRHRITDTIKTDCRESKGKHDSFSVYRCFDDEAGKYVSFDPGKDWELIDGDHPDCRPETKESEDRPKGDDEEIPLKGITDE